MNQPHYNPGNPGSYPAPNGGHNSAPGAPGAPGAHPLGIPPKKGSGAGKKIGIGCGIVFLIVVLMGACAVAVFSAGSETTPGVNEEASASTESTESTADTPSAQADPDTEEADVPREYRNALQAAKTYVDMMHMSKAGVYEQLTSEYGNSYPPEAAQYAVDNLDVDFNEVALKSAQNYQETMPMSRDEIYNQLTSDYGEKFTPEEAQYALDHLEQ